MNNFGKTSTPKLNQADKLTLRLAKYGHPYPSIWERAKGWFATDEQLIKSVGGVTGYETVRDVNMIGRYFTLGTHNDQALIAKGYNTNVSVFAIINKISSVASMPTWEIYEVVDRKAYQAYNAVKSQPYSESQRMKSAYLKTKALRLVENSPIADVFNQPNERQSGAEYMQSLLNYKLLTGDCYEYANMTKRGDLVELWIMPSQHVQIENNRSFPLRETGYILDITGRNITYKPETVSHSAFFNPNEDGNGSSLYGMSPLDAAYLNILQDNEARAAAVEILKNRGMRGIVSWQTDSDLAKEWGHKLTMEQTGRLKEGWRNMGNEYRDSLAVLYGDVKYTNLTLAPKDLMITEVCKMNLIDLCNAFGVSSILFNNVDASSYNNFITARKDLITSVVLPLLTTIRDARNRKLKKDWNNTGKRLVCDFDHTIYTELDSDKKATAEWMKAAGVFTDNQILDQLGWEQNPDPLSNMVWKKTNERPMQALANMEISKGQSQEDETVKS